MPPTTRALELLFQTIREVDSFDELARVQMTAGELYADDSETLGELTRALDGRATVLRSQLRLFPAQPVDVPDADMGAAPYELVREWCEQVRGMGPDELDALEQLTHAHRERASLGDLRAAIANRRRRLAAG
jgi:hypothetical protein